MKFIATLMLAILPLSAIAQNIDLSTVPHRDTVQLTIYNAEDLTLVRETRSITFKKGSNPLQFSWANTLIDPTSVELGFLTDPDKLAVIDTTFPHDKPQQLTWNVNSDIDGEATVEITYFTSGITWSADYVGILNPDASAMNLEGFVKVTNHSGEDYADAQVRLVVGKINLVERIADLARRGIVPASAPMVVGRSRALRDELRENDGRSVFAAKNVAIKMDQAAQVIKEGLSEYFIFAIEGKQTIPNQWSKRMRSFPPASVPMKTQYRYRPQEYGQQLVQVILMTNDTASQLGSAPLPDGVFRVFRQFGNNADGLGYVAQQTIRYIPIGDKIELNVGPNPQVVFELETLRVFRDELWMKLQGVKVLKRVDQPGVRITPNSRLVGWNTHTIYSQSIRNDTDRPIDVEIRRHYAGDITFTSDFETKSHDANTVQYAGALKAGQSADLLYEVTQKEGKNAKQNRVVVKQGQVEPVNWR